MNCAFGLWSWLPDCRILHFGGSSRANAISNVYHPRTSLTGSRTRQSLAFPYADQSLAASATGGKVSILAAGGVTKKSVPYELHVRERGVIQSNGNRQTFNLLREQPLDSLFKHRVATG